MGTKVKIVPSIRELAEDSRKPMRTQGRHVDYQNHPRHEDQVHLKMPTNLSNWMTEHWQQPNNGRYLALTSCIAFGDIHLRKITDTSNLYLFSQELLSMPSNPHIE